MLFEVKRCGWEKGVVLPHPASFPPPNVCSPYLTPPPPPPPEMYIPHTLPTNRATT